jgi:predicted secreted Zn-dependent protease
MKVRFLDSHPRFHSRVVKLYLPLFILGGLGLAAPVFKVTPAAQAAAVSRQSRIVYDGVYSSNPAPATNQLAKSLSCRPDTGFTPAGPITAPSSQTGVIERSDPIYDHLMYGYTAGQLDDLSRECPLVIPGDDRPYINAYTSYWLGWRFDYSPVGGGACRVSNIQVLIHIRQALPVWANQDQASARLAADWRAYKSAVTTHENGHLQLIGQYGDKLLAGLKSFPPMDCGAIGQAANTLAAGYVRQLKQADAAYETTTQSGLTQGAIVP